MKLEVDRLSFAYRGAPVLSDVSLELDQGQVLCVLGPNGAGKSTLFRCVLGLLRGYSGSVRLGGEEVSGLSSGETARRIAYIPQNPAPAFRYTVFDTVLMGTVSRLGAFSTPGAKQAASARDALEKLGISRLADRVVDTLSGGERQLTYIARALAQDSPLIVMDEPTSSLDFGNTLRVMETVCGLARRGYGIMLSTHDPDQALRRGIRALVLDGGRVRGFGPSSEAVTPELLSHVYGVPIGIASVSADGAVHRVCVPGRII